MFKPHIKKLFILLVILSGIVLTGCWDKMEIDERSYVLALGIDHISPDQAPQIEMVGVLERHNHYNVTYVFPNQMGGLAEAEVEKMSISSVGENIFLTESQLATRMNSELFLGHLKTVVLGEKVVKTPKMFKEVLDALEKDPNISRKIGLAVVEGEAQAALEVEPKLEPITGLFLNDLFRGRDRTPRAPLGDLNDILISLHNNGNAPIPRLTISEEELQLAGTAVISNFEFVGWLGEIETLILMIVRDEADLWYLTIEDDEIRIPFQVTESNRKFNLVEENGQLKMQIDIQLEGDIKQYIFNPPNDLLDPEHLEKLQSQINERLVTATMYLIEKLQREYETDVLGFDEHIRKFHPKTWKRVGEDWRDVFPNIEVEVIVDAKIRRVGLSR